MTTPTPETDAAVVEASQYYQPLYPSANGRNQPVHADFARKLERERDAANSTIAMQAGQIQQLRDDRDAWKAKAERTCVWSNREWSEFCKTECGERFQIPRQVKYKCCPSCGGRIVKEEE